MIIGLFLPGSLHVNVNGNIQNSVPGFCCGVFGG